MHGFGWVRLIRGVAWVRIGAVTEAAVSIAGIGTVYPPYPFEIANCGPGVVSRDTCQGVVRQPIPHFHHAPDVIGPIRFELLDDRFFVMPIGGKTVLARPCLEHKIGAAAKRADWLSGVANLNPAATAHFLVGPIKDDERLPWRRAIRLGGSRRSLDIGAARKHERGKGHQPEKSRAGKARFHLQNSLFIRDFPFGFLLMVSGVVSSDFLPGQRFR